MNIWQQLARKIERKKMYKISKKLEELADKVIRERDDVSHLKEYGVQIIFLECNKEVKENKVTYADTERIKDKYRAIIEADFIITFYTSITDKLSEKQKEILMWHELKHVGFDGYKRWIIPHDAVDFIEIIKEYGVDWADIKENKNEESKETNQSTEGNDQ